MGLSGSTISISFTTFECFQGESHTLYKDILARWWPLTQVVPLWSEFALGAARFILQYSARSRFGKRSRSTLWWWEILHEMGIEHYLNGNIIIIHKCIMFFHCHVWLPDFVEHFEAWRMEYVGRWDHWFNDWSLWCSSSPCQLIQKTWKYKLFVGVKNQEHIWHVSNMFKTSSGTCGVAPNSLWRH